MAKNTDDAQTCKTCGALIDSELIRKHIDWHKDLEARIVAAGKTGGVPPRRIFQSGR